MSDGNTLIGNAIVGHGMEKDGATTQGGAFLAGEEEAVISQEEEHIMSGEVTSEEDEKVEQQLLTVALVNSVVETSAPQSPPKADDSKPVDESKQRYSLRKRRRTGEPLEDPGAHSPSVKKAATRIQGSPGGSKKPPAVPLVNGHVKQQAPSAARQQAQVSAKQPTPHPTSKAIPKPKVKTEAVPACRVAVAAAPLPVPLAISSLPTPSSLPPALQPPLRPKLPPIPPASASNRTARAKPSKAKRLAPPARVLVSSKPLTPNPTATGVPNPLSIPLPASKSILVKKPPEKAPASSSGAPTSAHAFKAGTKLTVPCPLPPSTFESSVHESASNTQPAIKSETEPMPEKKKVTIDPDLPSSRGRIFSIDLDPASLDFSVLDTGESGTPAPASADLPLVTGGGRDRAFSFECFAFGINADEPLPPLAEQAAAENEAPGSQHLLPRPRGDSIIFDPMSFQEGGIHEEHALKTREARGISIDLNANGNIIPSSEPAHPAPVPDVPPYPAPSYSAEPLPPPPPPAVSMGGASSRLPPGKPPHMVHSSRPDSAASNARISVAPPPPHHHAPPPHHHHPGAYHHAHHKPGPPGAPHPAVVPSNPLSQGVATGPPGTAVAIIGSCATSTTLQMELLNKDGRIGIYLPEARKERIARFHAKRKMRIWRKRIKYDCRKKLADSRPRIKGRFVKRTDTD